MRIKQLLESATGMSTASVATVTKGSKGMIKRQKPTDNALDSGKLFQETNAAEGKEDKIAQLKKDHDTAVHWSKNEKSPQKREAARQKAEKIKRHLDTQYKQGVAEGWSWGWDSADDSSWEHIYKTSYPEKIKAIAQGGGIGVQRTNNNVVGAVRILIQYWQEQGEKPGPELQSKATAQVRADVAKAKGAAEDEVKENKKGVRAVKHTVKPRNFVAKNAVQSGAGAHKDKKKAQKQGDTKHKNKEPAYESKLWAALDRRIIK
jgi:hypothetical protein